MCAGYLIGAGKGMAETRKNGQSETTPVKGGWIKRDSRSGQLLEVGSDVAVHKATPESRAAVQDASARRSAALRRLADR